MKKTWTAVAIATLTALATTSGVSAGSPTCENMFGSGWKNHGEHVLGYVNGDGAAGGAPAHRMDDVFMNPPGASFCLSQASSHR